MSDQTSPSVWPYTWQVLFEDEHLMVAAKPAGLPTQAPLGIASLELQVKSYLATKAAPGTAEVESRGSRVEGRAKTTPPQADAAKSQVYLGVPHRLDRPVSGPVVLGLNRKATQRLAAQFEARTVKKLYWACVEGVVDPPEGDWTDYIRKIPERAHVEIVWPDHPEGRLAVLKYRTLGTSKFGSWLEIALETGRMHQIRIQATAHGHPVVGDEQYGSRVPFSEPSVDVRQHAIALHGRTLVFRHPRLAGSVEVEVPLPKAWETLHLTPRSQMND